MCPISGCINPCISLPVDHAAAAQPGADGQVDKGVQPLRRAPAMFAQRRAVDIRVKADRHAQRLPAPARENRCAPSLVWASS